MPESVIPQSGSAYISDKPSPRVPGWVRLVVVCTFTPLLTDCGLPAPGRTPESATRPTSLPAQTLTPQPAPAFEYGTIELPEGVLLLLSNATWHGCSPECECPDVEGLPRGYNILEDRLYLYSGGMDRSWEDAPLPEIVLAYGDFEHALAAVRVLPFVEQGPFPILAALEDGMVVYEWDGHPYRLGIGESWQVARKTDYGGGCVITDTSSLRNLGLWREDQVDIIQ